MILNLAKNVITVLVAVKFVKKTTNHLCHLKYIKKIILAKLQNIANQKTFAFPNTFTSARETRSEPIFIMFGTQ